MARMGEHINGLDLTNLIAAFTKDGGVTGKRGRSAGNVDDAFWDARQGWRQERAAHSRLLADQGQRRRGGFRPSQEGAAL